MFSNFLELLNFNVGQLWKRQHELIFTKDNDFRI